MFDSVGGSVLIIACSSGRISQDWHRSAIDGSEFLLRSGDLGEFSVELSQHLVARMILAGKQPLAILPCAIKVSRSLYRSSNAPGNCETNGNEPK